MNFHVVLNVSRTESETIISMFNLLSLFLGGSEQGSGFSTAVSSAGPALSAPNQSSASSDKYAALAELDSVFSSTATSSNAYTATSNASRYGPTLLQQHTVAARHFSNLFLSKQGGIESVQRYYWSCVLFQRRAALRDSTHWKYCQWNVLCTFLVMTC